MEARVMASDGPLLEHFDVTPILSQAYDALRDPSACLAAGLLLVSRSAIAAPGFDEGFDLQWSNTITYAGDFDGDGMKDILLNYGDATGFRALYSTGAGFKQEWTLAWSPTDVYVGDFNGDGRDDF
ncbi:FG-GAP repeat domain-containing protein [Nannocystis pusilla]|uniref:FG-GAP repeat domain-containing protein n=1 Tax=Nannocystis pusilla TaxID=889268 RepID=UPI003B7F03B0